MGDVLYIVVPCYNEEAVLPESSKQFLGKLKSLIKAKKIADGSRIIFVDDGSKDQTFSVVENAFKNNDKVKVISKANGGKASALNFGIQQSNAEFVVCIDADTQLKKDAVTQLIRTFYLQNKPQEIGAVAGNVKIGNEINMITKWQSIEYITSQNFDRRAFNLLNCITVVPGAIGAFRREAILEVGGFTTDTLAEDCDLTMKLHKAGYVVENCNDAISYTEAPETLKQFLKQRLRWSFGILQSFWKHKDAIFRKEYK